MASEFRVGPHDVDAMEGDGQREWDQVPPTCAPADGAHEDEGANEPGGEDEQIPQPEQHHTDARIAAGQAGEVDPIGWTTLGPYKRVLCGVKLYRLSLPMSMSS
jgi:hypothetical protein